MDNCIFCKIINGDIPSATLYEDEKYKAMMDINPANLGHVLVIPKTHAANIFEIDEKTLAGVHMLAQKIAVGINKALNPDGINIVQNNGEASGQTVGHFHVHVIPRYNGDGISMGWQGKTPSIDEINAYCDKIKKEL